jgi:hypothetical protein
VNVFRRAKQAAGLNSVTIKAKKEKPRGAGMAAGRIGVTTCAARGVY